MSGFKQTALIISEKSTPVTPTENGDISVVARDGKLLQYDGTTEKELLTSVVDLSESYVNVSGDTMTGGLHTPNLSTSSVTISGSGGGLGQEPSLIELYVTDAVGGMIEAENHKSNQILNFITDYNGNPVLEIKSDDGSKNLQLDAGGNLDIKSSVTIVDLAGNTDEIVTLDANGKLQASGFTIASLGVSGGDLLADLLNSEVSITTTVSLDSSAFGKMHVVSGTTSDYTITLPAASSNVGKIIGIRIASTATKLFTIDANGTETIDGATTRVMWAGESAILLCDGTGWTKIAGKTIPMAGCLYLNGTQTINNTTITVVDFSSVDFDIGSIATTASDRFTIRRAGNYIMGANIRYTSNTSNVVYADLRVNGTKIVRSSINSASGVAAGVVTGGKELAATDYVDVATYHEKGSSADLVAGESRFWIEEKITW